MPVRCGNAPKQLAAGYVCVYLYENGDKWAGIFHKQPEKTQGATLPLRTEAGAM
jgi:hypothetical protein